MAHRLTFIELGHMALPFCGVSAQSLHLPWCCKTGSNSYLLACSKDSVYGTGYLHNCGGIMKWMRIKLMFLISQASKNCSLDFQGYWSLQANLMLVYGKIRLLLGLRPKAGFYFEVFKHLKENGRPWQPVNQTDEALQILYTLSACEASYFWRGRKKDLDGPN